MWENSSKNNQLFLCISDTVGGGRLADDSVPRSGRRIDGRAQETVVD